MYRRGVAITRDIEGEVGVNQVTEKHPFDLYSQPTPQQLVAIIVSREGRLEEFILCYLSSSF